MVSLGDEITDITTGLAKVTIRAPFAFTPTNVLASLTQKSSLGAIQFDINDGSTSILSTKITIDSSQLTSVTAGTSAVLSSTGIAADAEITFDIDSVFAGAQGAKITIVGDPV
ncbi:MAG: hypothetical protein IIC18_08780 [Bacteroidetes bacterium]|nr:hypothetical protein [Bacteroidota bacterium]